MRLLSGYLETSAGVDAAIAACRTYGLDGYRASFYVGQGNHYWNPSLIAEFHSKAPDLIIIVDRDHYYPPTTSADWNAIQQHALETCRLFPFAWVELVNEYKASDLPSRAQTVINTVRNAGFNNPIVVNKWDHTWSQMAQINDSNWWCGYHYYFDYWSPSGAKTQMDQARAAGLQIMNTEVGASTSDSGINSSNTAELNQHLAYSESLGFSNCLWMNTRVNNLSRYLSAGLNWLTNPPQTPTYLPCASLQNIISGPYTLYWNNGSVEEWLNSGWVNLAAAVKNLFPYIGVTVNLIGSGLGVQFVKSKFDRLLDIFQAAGITDVVVCSQPDYGESQKIIGSDVYSNAVMDFVNLYKGDSRIKGLLLFQEPQETFLNLPRAEAQAWMADLAREVRQTAPWFVIYPDWTMCYWDNLPQRLTDMKATGIDTVPGVYIDVSHPYYSGDLYHPGKTPTEMALYNISQIDAALLQVSQAKALIGETHVWYPENNVTFDEGATFMSKLLQGINIHFHIFATLGLRQRYDCQLEAMSGYIPPASDIKLTLMAGTGGTVEYPGLHMYPLNSTETFTATPDADHDFDYWQVDATQYTSNPLTLTITQDLDGAVLMAYFKQKEQPPTPPPCPFVYIKLPAKGLNALRASVRPRLPMWLIEAYYKLGFWLLNNG